MNTKIKNEIIRLAEENPSEEICGFIYHTLSSVHVFPAKNISHDPAHSFLVNPEDYIQCEKLGKVIGIYHSHPHANSIFSESDIETAEEWILPFYVYSLKDKGFKEYLPRAYAVPLEGRPFIWGVYDCYSLARDYYWQKFGIYGDDYDRDETFHGSNSSTTPFLPENFEKEGFHIIKNMGEFKKHDVLLYRSRQVYPHHLAVFLGDSRILQHCVNRLSEISMIGSNPASKLYAILRYKDSSKF